VCYSCRTLHVPSSRQRLFLTKTAAPRISTERAIRAFHISLSLSPSSVILPRYSTKLVYYFFHSLSVFNIQSCLHSVHRHDARGCETLLCDATVCRCWRVSVPIKIWISNTCLVSKFGCQSSNNTIIRRMGFLVVIHGVKVFSVEDVL
jgi:hypothetical protein